MMRSSTRLSRDEMMMKDPFSPPRGVNNSCSPSRRVPRSSSALCVPQTAIPAQGNSASVLPSSVSSSNPSIYCSSSYLVSGRAVAATNNNSGGVSSTSSQMNYTSSGNHRRSSGSSSGRHISAGGPSPSSKKKERVLPPMVMDHLLPASLSSPPHPISSSAQLPSPGKCQPSLPSAQYTPLTSPTLSMPLSSTLSSPLQANGQRSAGGESSYFSTSTTLTPPKRGGTAPTGAGVSPCHAMPSPSCLAPKEPCTVEVCSGSPRVDSKVTFGCNFQGQHNPYPLMYYEVSQISILSSGTFSSRTPQSRSPMKQHHEQKAPPPPRG